MNWLTESSAPEPDSTVHSTHAMTIIMMPKAMESEKKICA